MKSWSPVTEPMPPSRAMTAETPAMMTTTPTATQPRPWIRVPMSRPGAPPQTIAVPIRRTRSR